ncbi:unnamed protein product, partial [Rotaria socialis]
MERNVNEYSELFYHCVQVLNEYKNDISEEIFLQEYFQINKVPDQAFISTILFDCSRHAALLKAIMAFFYKNDGSHVKKSEQNIFKVLIYMIIFQIETVEFKLIRGFINSVQLFQMHQ